MKQIKVFSAFSGCGMVFHSLDTLGIEYKGWSSEIEKHPMAVEKYHYPHIKQLGVIENITKKDIEGEVDLLVGGFPCQAFSVAGQKKGFTDPRGQLFFEALRLVKELQPRYFILENVKGILSVEYIEKIKGICGETVDGVSGFLLSDMEVDIRRKVVDKINGDLWGIQPVLINGALVSAQQRERVWWVGERQADGTYKKVEVKQPKDRGILVGDILEDSVDDKYFESDKATETYKKMKDKTQILIPERAEKAGTISAGYHMFGYNRQRVRVSGTGGHNVPIINRLRKLTEVECERLMTLPDNFTKYGKYHGEDKEVAMTNRYKMLGNGFQPAVVAHIVKHLDL